MDELESEIMVMPVTTMRGHTYAPLGHCMYCTSTDGKRTKEHIIPESLGGALILLDSVCTICQTTTGRPEQRSLNADLLPPRTILELRRKHVKRKVPHKLPLVSTAGLKAPAESFGIELSRDDFPKLFTLLCPAPAGPLIGLNRGPDLEDYHFAYISLGQPVKADVTLDDISWRVPFLHSELAYSLAKWAYSFAVAEGRASDVDTSAIRDFLLLKRDDSYNFVGERLEGRLPRASELHVLSCHMRGDLLTVVIHLFASCPGAAYEVVIGRRITP